MWLGIAAGIIAALIIVVYLLTKYFYDFGMLRNLSEKNLRRCMNTDANSITKEQKMLIIRGFKYMDKLPKEEFWTESFDGLKLHGVYYPAEEKSNKFALCIHGCRTSAKNEFAPFIRFYHSHGFNVLMPDDRTHGESEGELIGFGTLDRLDALKWTKLLVDKFGEDIEIYMHGVSMGAATAINCCAEEELPCQVKGLIADCSFTSVIEQFTNSYKSIFHLPAWPFVPLCSLMSKHKAGYDFYEHSPLENAAKIKIPVLFIQGDADNLVKPEMAMELYNACSSRKKILFIEGAGHAQCILTEPRLYKDTIKEFFNFQ